MIFPLKPPFIRDFPIKTGFRYARSVATQQRPRAYVAEDLGLGTLRGDQRLQLPRLLRLRPPPSPGFNGDLMGFYGGLLGSNGIYPLVN